jgi:hypothetical protein
VHFKNLVNKGRMKADMSLERLPKKGAGTFLSTSASKALFSLTFSLKWMLLLKKSSNLGQLPPLGTLASSPALWAQRADDERRRSQGALNRLYHSAILEEY